mgnify:CR=1 FL=1
MDDEVVPIVDDWTEDELSAAEDDELIESAAEENSDELNTSTVDELIGSDVKLSPVDELYSDKVELTMSTMEQSAPAKPLAQRQLKLSKPSTQEPPLRHGLLAHSSMFTEQSSPVIPGRQSQVPGITLYFGSHAH